MIFHVSSQVFDSFQFIDLSLNTSLQSTIYLGINILGGSDTSGFIYGVIPLSLRVVVRYIGLSSSSASTANRICLGVSRFNPLLLQTLPESSNISAQIYSKAAAMKTGEHADTFYVLNLFERNSLPILPTGKVIPALID